MEPGQAARFCISLRLRPSLLSPRSTAVEAEAQAEAAVMEVEAVG
jgi:hypothetical protein